MKLSEIIKEDVGGIAAGGGVPVVGPDASRPTPAASIQHYGDVNAPLPNKFCKGRTWCERKEKKKKKSKALRDLERGIDNASPRPF